MRIQQINNQSKLSFDGKLAKTSALEKYIHSLNKVDLELFLRNKKIMEGFSDNAVYTYETRLVGDSFEGTLETSHRLLKNGNEIIDESGIKPKAIFNKLFDFYNPKRAIEEADAYSKEQNESQQIRDNILSDLKPFNTGIKVIPPVIKKDNPEYITKSYAFGTGFNILDPKTESLVQTINLIKECGSVLENRMMVKDYVFEDEHTKCSGMYIIEMPTMKILEARVRNGSSLDIWRTVAEDGTLGESTNRCND